MLDDHINGARSMSGARHGDFGVAHNDEVGGSNAIESDARGAAEVGSRDRHRCATSCRSASGIDVGDRRANSRMVGADSGARDVQLKKAGYGPLGEEPYA